MTTPTQTPRRQPPGMVHTIATLRACCDALADDQADDARDCREWAGAHTTNGHPTVRHGGKQVLARRLAYELAIGPVRTRHVLTPRCGNRSCINPAHQVQRSNRQHLQAMATAPRTSEFARRAKIAAHQRDKAAKLTPAMVAEILTSTEPQRTLAAQYGVNKTMISRIRTGRAWRDYTSPFAGVVSALGGMK